jgi:nucleoside-diphosphate-sugar epimerase
MTRAFVTGGTGFLGSRVIAALSRKNIPAVALDRSGSLAGKSDVSSGVEAVKADLLQPELYRQALAKTDVVLHLAALTGRATEQEHFRVNAEGTETLVKESRQAGVQRILFVSSIATKFPDKTRYYYALAKRRAEEAVRDSGLRFTIIRPTIIIGPGSPILSALEKLAAMPVIPIFGNGRALVQPIYVDDVAEYIMEIVQHDRFRNETLELGGPATLTIEELIQDIRRARKQDGSKGPSFHIPMGLLLPILRTVESAGLGSLLPFSVGQLSSFRYDGTIEPNGLHEKRRPALRSVREMLTLSITA